MAHSFSSYNFKQYFLRRTRDKFRSDLPSLFDAAYAPASSIASSSSSSTPSPPSPSSSSSAATPSPSEDDSIYAPTSTPVAQAAAAPSNPDQRLREWYGEALSELAVMARAAIVNRMYEAPKLVVEGKTRGAA